MANIRLIRRRIRGVQSISKITRAMEMIATSKMRRAQERGLAGRPYSEKIRQVIADLAALPQADRALHPLLQRRPVTKIAIVHITPDRGLCGGLNANINRRTGSFILEQKCAGYPYLCWSQGAGFYEAVSVVIFGLSLPGLATSLVCLILCPYPELLLMIILMVLLMLSIWPMLSLSPPWCRDRWCSRYCRLNRRLYPEHRM